MGGTVTVRKGCQVLDWTFRGAAQQDLCWGFGGYIRAAKRLAGFLGRSPDTVTAEELRRFQLYLVDRGVSPVSLNATITGLRFFFGKCQSYFALFSWGGTGLRSCRGVDGLFVHLLEQLHVHVLSGSPLGSRDVSQPGGNEH